MLADFLQAESFFRIFFEHLGKKIFEIVRDLGVGWPCIILIVFAKLLVFWSIDNLIESLGRESFHLECIQNYG